jgi:GMP synthase-like glutamine amidotransferase
MKTALLLCDDVSPAYQSIAPGGYPRMFRELLPELDMTDFLLTKGEFPEKVSDFDCYLVSGSRHSVYDDLPWIDRAKSLIQEIQQAGKYYLGVCFGHQLLAESLGGKVEKAASGWMVGVHRFSVPVPQPWMQSPQQQFQVLMMCQDQVQQLPPGGKILASSSVCPVGMFQVGERMLGIQGHPEFTKVYERALLEDRLERIGPAVVHPALESLSLTVDRSVMAGWMMDFVRDRK